MMLKCGRLTYLNALPFYTPFTQNRIVCSAELVDGVPADLNHALDIGDIDLSLISSYEYLRHSEKYELLPGLCIAAYKKVLSVTLYIRKELERDDLDGKTIAMTPQSASSAQLVKVLCSQFWKVSPHFVALPSLQDCDQYSAFLLIGDQALYHLEYPGYHAIDLAQAWYECTALPMTFAVFAARKKIMRTRGDEVIALQQQLASSLQWSESNWDVIYQTAMAQSTIPKETLRLYYSLMRYRLGDSELQGLHRYADLCGLPLELKVS